MSQTKATGNYIDPNSPAYSLSYDPRGGSGILKAIIFFESRLLNCPIPLERYLGYTWSETVNGIELEIEKPFIENANAIEEDIINSLHYERIKFDTINFITK